MTEEVTEEAMAGGPDPLPSLPGRGRAAREEEPIPRYVERLEECARGDMIALGSLSLEQVRVKKGHCHICSRGVRLSVSTLSLMEAFGPHRLPQFD